MKIIDDIQTLKDVLKQNSDDIGFVPTMGALHYGHISLIQKSRQQNTIVVVSIFVNPTQFLANEDFDKYPNTIDNDIELCKLHNVDILFAPNINMMYGNDEIKIKAPNQIGFILEGHKRPTHFDGMLQIVLKLFNIVNPKDAYFGKKDAQQLILIKQMVNNLFLDINIIGCDIVRQDNGLALSSRNVYLNEKQTKNALLLSSSLKLAKDLIVQSEYQASIIIKNMYDHLDSLDVEYISIVDHNFNNLDCIIPNNTIILLAINIDGTRLIDNIWV